MNLKSTIALCAFTLAQSVFADDFIRINTDNVDLILRVKDNGRVYQSYLGKHLRYEADLQNLPDGTEAYLTHGMEDYFEPAIDIQHTDKNPSLLLKYVSNTTSSKDGGNETVVTLKDDKYPITVKLHYIMEILIIERIGI